MPSFTIPFPGDPTPTTTTTFIQTIVLFWEEEEKKGLVVTFVCLLPCHCPGAGAVAGLVTGSTFWFVQWRRDGRAGRGKCCIFVCSLPVSLAPTLCVMLLLHCLHTRIVHYVPAMHAFGTACLYIILPYRQACLPFMLLLDMPALPAFQTLRTFGSDTFFCLYCTCYSLYVYTTIWTTPYILPAGSYIKLYTIWFCCHRLTSHHFANACPLHTLI